MGTSLAFEAHLLHLPRFLARATATKPVGKESGSALTVAPPELPEGSPCLTPAPTLASSIFWPRSLGPAFRPGPATWVWLAPTPRALGPLPTHSNICPADVQAPLGAKGVPASIVPGPRRPIRPERPSAPRALPGSGVWTPHPRPGLEGGRPPPEGTALPQRGSDRRRRGCGYCGQRRSEAEGPLFRQGWREGTRPGLGWVELTRCSLTFALSSPELFLPSAAQTIHRLGGLSPGP